MATAMTQMTGIERMSNILKRKPVDRIGLSESFWGDTRREWESGGHIQKGVSFADNFGFDLDKCWPFSMIADLDFVPVVVEETD